jgi:putative transposase
MTSITTKLESSQPAAETAVHLFDDWFDSIEAGLRDRVRDFIHAMIEGELDTALSRPRYARHATPPSGEVEGAVGTAGHRHGHRSRSLLGSFGQVEIEVPRARLNTADGKTTEWKSQALRAYQRRTVVADALIAGSYLAGTNTRGAPCARLPVWWRGRQGHGEPGLAQGEDRLGRLERPPTVTNKPPLP